MPVSGMFTGSSSDYLTIIVQVKTEQLRDGVDVQSPKPVA
jgi:hypothetical protein